MRQNLKELTYLTKAFNLLIYSVIRHLPRTVTSLRNRASLIYLEARRRTKEIRPGSQEAPDY